METTTEQDTSEFRPIVLRFSIRGTRNGGLTPYTRVRFWLWSKILGAALRVGYIVFVIGRQGAGKSVMLARVTPGKVVDKMLVSRDPKALPYLRFDEIPGGFFSIDEPQFIDKASFKAAVVRLAQENRHFVVASQQERVLNELFDNVTLWRSWRRVLVVKLV